MDNTSGLSSRLSLATLAPSRFDFAVHTHAPYAPTFELNITFPRYAREVRTADPPFIGLPLVRVSELCYRFSAHHPYYLSFPYTPEIVEQYKLYVIVFSVFRRYILL